MKTIKQIVNLKANPHAVYEALMDSAKHSQFTGDKAIISREVGGKFTVWGDYIEGTNLELVADSKIVQSWHASDWPEGHYSTVTYSMEKTKTGTRLTFTQLAVPDEFYDDIKQGWLDFYWTPLKKMLG
ncbi:MAG: SRPBCC family protein [Chloroflexi bacterium]|nr:SRPBCC family protein [Chloroflexota bacterium]